MPRTTAVTKKPQDCNGSITTFCSHGRVLPDDNGEKEEVVRTLCHLLFHGGNMPTREKTNSVARLRGLSCERPLCLEDSAAPNSGFRPREKLVHLGASSLSDSELLALLFGTGCRGQSAEDLARGLLARFGSLHRLMSADMARVTKVAGVGLARHALLQAALELSRRCAAEVLLERRIVNAPEQVRDFLSLHFAGQQQEVFSVLMLDNRNHLIVCRDMFMGTIDGAAVYPREVVKACLSLNAAAVILAHNHPSGDPEPSSADIAITRKLTDALGLVDIRVLDHLVVGQGVQVSLAERGLM